MKLGADVVGHISCANAGVREKVNRCWNKGWDGAGAGSGFAEAIYLMAQKSVSSSGPSRRRCRPLPKESCICGRDSVAHVSGGEDGGDGVREGWDAR